MTTVLHIGATSAVFAGRGTLLDGVTPVPREVALRFSDNGAVLVVEEDILWPVRAIRRLPDVAGGDLLILRHRGDPLTRLLVEDRETVRQITARLPDMTRRAPVKGLRRLWLWAVAAIASVAVIITVLVPVMADQLAEYLPPAGEKALGETTLEQIRSSLDKTGLNPLPTCDTPDGMAALAKMTGRLVAHTDLPYDVQVQVLNHSMVNAFALPGGFVVIFRGLIDTAEDPDEVAAVLAHELGHVVSRDPARHALRSAGSIGVLGLLLGDFAGGTAVLFLTEQLIQARYSQKAEAAADTFAHDLLTRAKLPPQALGTMFERLRKLSGDPDPILQHFEDHPELTRRIEAARRAAFTQTVPSLTDAEWTALKTICR